MNAFQKLAQDETLWRSFTASRNHLANILKADHVGVAAAQAQSNSPNVNCKFIVNRLDEHSLPSQFQFDSLTRFKLPVKCK